MMVKDSNMTVKEGDTVFVSQPHHNQEVAGVAMPGSSGNVAHVHLFSSADPYAILNDMKERQYKDHYGFRVAGQPEPTDYSPEIKASFQGVGGTGTPQDLKEEFPDGPSGGVDTPSTESEETDEDDDDEDDDDEEDEDEQQEGETAPQVSAGESDGE